MTEQTTPGELLGLTADIVASHVSNNKVEVAELSNLIQEVYRTLAAVDETGGTKEGSC